MYRVTICVLVRSYPGSSTDVPSVMVFRPTWEEFKDGSVRISQAIVVERDSQRAIVIGKGGARLRSLGESSRRELEEMMERRVHLKLFVKVREDWTDDTERYREMGLDFTN